MTQQTPGGGWRDWFPAVKWSNPTIRMDRDVVQVGDTVRLFVDHKNISRQLIIIGIESKNTRTTSSRYHVDVRDDKGELAPETKWGRFFRTGKKEPGEPETVEVGGYGELRVPPGVTYTGGIELNDLYELRQAGKYTAQIVDMDEKGNIIFESNKVTLTITK